MSEVEELHKSDVVKLGRITSVYGLRGWLKIYSWTDPPENILSYSRWELKFPDGSQKIAVLASGRVHGRNIVAQLEGCQDRTTALSFKGADIFVQRDELPALDADDFYWYQLEGLTVFTEDEQTGQQVLLGKVSHLVATGSNDVLVIQSTPDSLDDRERLIPYLPDEFIKRISLQDQTMVVDWPVDF